jgi:hypothetical protein
VLDLRTVRAASSSVLLGSAVLALVVVACGQIAGIEDPPPSAAAPTTTTPGPSGPPPAVDITPATLDFGDVPCGAPSPAKLIALLDKGSAPADFQIQIPQGSPFKADPASGTLQPNTPATSVNVTATTTSTTDVSTDIVVSAGATVQTVSVHTKGTGATYDVLTPSIDFGEVRLQSGGSAVATIRNSGTEQLVVTDFTSDNPDFAIDWNATPKPFTLDPGKTANVTLLLNPGAETVGAVQLSANITPTIPGIAALCGTTTPILVTGRRVSLDVTVSPADFGQQPCNSQPAPRNIVITNYTATALTYTTTAPNDFVVVSGGSGSVAAGSSSAPQTAMIAVQPNPLGAAPLGARTPENFTITIPQLPPPSGGARTVPATVDVRGAIIAANPTSITNFQSNGMYLDVKSLKLTNSGNEALGVAWSYSRPQGDAAWYKSFPTSLSVGQSTATMAFAPSGTCPCEAKMDMVVTSGTLCSGGPISLDFQGNY